MTNESTAINLQTKRRSYVAHPIIIKHRMMQLDLADALERRIKAKVALGYVLPELDNRAVELAMALHAYEITSNVCRRYARDSWSPLEAEIQRNTNAGRTR